MQSRYPHSPGSSRTDALVENGASGRMADFDGFLTTSETPSWAPATMRESTHSLAQRTSPTGPREQAMCQASAVVGTFPACEKRSPATPAIDP